MQPLLTITEIFLVTEISKTKTITFKEFAGKKRSREIIYIGRRSYDTRTNGDICFATLARFLNKASSQSVNTSNNFDLSFKWFQFKELQEIKDIEYQLIKIDLFTLSLHFFFFSASKAINTCSSCTWWSNFSVETKQFWFFFSWFDKGTSSEPPWSLWALNSFFMDSKLNVLYIQIAHCAFVDSCLITYWTNFWKQKTGVFCRLNFWISHMYILRFLDKHIKTKVDLWSRIHIQLCWEENKRCRYFHHLHPKTHLKL